MLGNLRMSFSISEATRRPHLSLSHADSGDVDEYDAADEFRPNSNQLREFTGTYWSEEIDAAYRPQVDNNQVVGFDEPWILGGWLD
jgi:hypothetical protein